MDPFATLGATRRFDLDLAALEKTHRELSRALHPDKFAGTGASERRASLEHAANVNEAWRIVRDPVRRAEALFQLEGLAVGEANEPKPSPALLMEMMEEREALADARSAGNVDEVRRLGARIEARARAVQTKLSAAFGDPAAARPALEAALPLLGELRFYRRFLDEVLAIEEEEEERQARA